ncbi:MAG: hypothetical protein HQL50_04575 [Magnetococcales bacterium]|nr:hypothetical protein [Magnetococcales bacterium]
MFRFTTTYHALFGVLVALLLTPSTVAALPWYGGQFSADIIVYNPEKPEEKAQGQFYVGHEKFRAQGVHAGIKKSVIVDFGTRSSWTLLDNDKTFHKGLGNAPIPPKPDQDPTPSDQQKPCSLAQVTCQKAMEKVMVNNIMTERWTITANQGGRSMKMMLWIDPTRRIIIRQVTGDDGPIQERILLETGTLNGRATEKWEFVRRYRNQTASNVRWIDAKLRVPVRLVRKGKLLMELTNIQEGAQDPTLFTLPQNYTEVASPQQNQQMQQQRAPGGQYHQGR